MLMCFSSISSHHKAQALRRAASKLNIKRWVTVHKAQVGSVMEDASLRWMIAQPTHLGQNEKKKRLWSGPGLLLGLNYPYPALTTDIRSLLSCTSCPPLHCPMLPPPYVRCCTARQTRPPYLHSHSRAHSSDKGLIRTAVRMWNSLPEECVG